MAYTLPSVQVFQEFNASPIASTLPLSAHIAGGNAGLVRFEQADEKEKGKLGFYDNITENVFPYPNKPAGSLIDLSYTKLWMQNAILQYYTAAGTGPAGITKTAGFRDRIASSSVNFAANGTAYPRDNLLLDRDVQPGDVAKARATGTSGSVTLWTTIKAVLPEIIASIVDTAVADTNNPGSSSASATITQTHGPRNCITATGDASTYSPLADGAVVETYEILVTGSSTNSDLSTATLRVLSGSGMDDQAVVVPADEGQPTSIGTHGFKVTFHVVGSAGCSLQPKTKASPQPIWLLV